MEQEEVYGQNCWICGNDICCGLALAQAQASVVFVCEGCGASVAVQGKVSSPPGCYGQEMVLSPGAFW